MSTRRPSLVPEDPVSEKRVETRYDVDSAALERWSPRSFSERRVEPAKLRSMFEAARLAPSAHNTQPSRFLIGRKHHGDTYQRLFGCLSEGNQIWARSAPVLVLASVMRRRFSQERAEFVAYPHCMHDLGLAVMSLILQGQALGLHCHPMAAFDPEMAQAEFAIPPLFAPGVVIAIGYLGDPLVLPDALREHELGRRTRRPLEELVFEGAWDEASSLFAEDEGASGD
jgi:nitroreductase